MGPVGLFGNTNVINSRVMLPMFCSALSLLQTLGLFPFVSSICWAYDASVVPTSKRFSLPSWNPLSKISSNDLHCQRFGQIYYESYPHKLNSVQVILKLCWCNMKLLIFHFRWFCIVKSIFYCMSFSCALSKHLWRVIICLEERGQIINGCM